MSTVDTLERQDERRRARRVVLLIGVALLVFGMLVGRPWSGDQPAAEGPGTEVLSGSRNGADPAGDADPGRDAGRPIAGQGSAAQGSAPQNSAGQGDAGQSGQGQSGQGQGNATPGQGQPNNPGNEQPAPPVQTPANPRTFGISGDLAGIYPTYDGELVVRFSNPHRFGIVVDELDVVLTPPAGDCGAATGGSSSGLIALGDLPAGGVPVPPRTGNSFGASEVALDLVVSNGLPDACQGAAFTVAYSGTATRANQP